ncbi:MAG: IS66 family insertion sequence element accessory protein TnpA [Bacilli bacterium]
MAKISLSELWTQRLENYKNSGLSKAAWCRREGIKEHQLHYWINKTKENNTNREKTNRWIAVDTVLPTSSLVPTSEPSVIELTIHDVRIKVDASFNEELLQRVLAVVKSC